MKKEKITMKEVVLDGVLIRQYSNEKAKTFVVPKHFSGYNFHQWKQKNQKEIDLLFSDDFNKELDELENEYSGETKN